MKIRVASSCPVSPPNPKTGQIRTEMGVVGKKEMWLWFSHSVSCPWSETAFSTTCPSKENAFTPLLISRQEDKYQTPKGHELHTGPFAK